MSSRGQCWINLHCMIFDIPFPSFSMWWVITQGGSKLVQGLIQLHYANSCLLLSYFANMAKIWPYPVCTAIKMVLVWAQKQSANWLCMLFCCEHWLKMCLKTGSFDVRPWQKAFLEWFQLWFSSQKTGLIPFTSTGCLLLSVVRHGQSDGGCEKLG